MKDPELTDQCNAITDPVFDELLDAYEELLKDDSFRATLLSPEASRKENQRHIANAELLEKRAKAKLLELSHSK
ncbi:MAG TPA: hypothetical protein VFA65_22585 [Bryobacteraceae bacterium]|nr:hypothetical protein [Bryobacteraceae bacterium]